MYKILSYIKPNCSSNFDDNLDVCRNHHKINDSDTQKSAHISHSSSKLSNNCGDCGKSSSNDSISGNAILDSASHNAKQCQIDCSKSDRNNMAEERNEKRSTLSLTDEEYDKLICKICLTLMIPPVTLPCKHEMCLPCYEKSMDVVNLLCPFCRLRISCWSRNAIKRDQIVNHEKLRQIETKFPQFVNNNVFFEQEFDNFLKKKPINRVIASDGEIGKEFQVLIEKEREIQLKEEQQNKSLIKQLLDEEDERNNQLIEQTMNDESIARKLQNEENKRRVEASKRSRDSDDWYQFRRRKQIKYTEPDYHEFD